MVKSKLKGKGTKGSPLLKKKKNKMVKSKLKGKAMQEAREGWSSLPREIVALIVGRLVAFADRVRFRAVCKWWRDVLSGTVTAHPGAPPYLYLSHSRRILSLLENKTYYLRSVNTMTKQNNSRSFAVTNGWISVVDMENVSLFDPFSGARIKFPPLCNLPDVEAVEFDDDTNHATVYCLRPEGLRISAKHLCRTLFKRMTVSSTNTMKAIIIYHNFNKVALAGPYSKTWSKVEIPFLHLPRFQIIDVAYQEADNKFYAILRNGTMISIDPDDGNFEHIVPRDSPLQDLLPMSFCIRYFVSLPAREFLCIFVIFRKPFHIRKTTRFEIRKLVREDDENMTTWKRVEDLDGWTIFLDAKSARARSSKEAIGYEGNCIYFSFNYRVKCEGKTYSFRQSGIYHIGEKKILITRFHSKPRKYDAYKGLWIEPKKIVW